MTTKQLTGRVLLALTLLGGTMTMMPSVAEAANSVTVTKDNVADYNTAGVITATVVGSNVSYVGNTVTINDTSNTPITVDILGAADDGSGLAPSGNTVQLQEGTIGVQPAEDSEESMNQRMAGGVSYVEGNAAAVTAKTANDNTVVISGGTIDSSLLIAGGLSAGNAQGTGLVTTGNVAGNAVTVSGGTFNATTLMAGGLSQGLSTSDGSLVTGNAANNALTISGGTFTETPTIMAGGLTMAGMPIAKSFVKSAVSGNASGNTAAVAGVKFSYGEQTNILGGGGSLAIAKNDNDSEVPTTRTASAGDAAQNKVNVTDSTFDGSLVGVTGGISLGISEVTGDVTGNTSSATASSADASQNSAVLQNAQLTGSQVIGLGGASGAIGLITSGAGTTAAVSGNVTGNTLTVSGNSVLAGSMVAGLGGGVSAGVAVLSDNSGSATGTSGTVSQNSVIVDGGSITGTEDSSVRFAVGLGGGSAAVGFVGDSGSATAAAGAANNNSLYFSNGQVNGETASILVGGVEAGFAYLSQNGTATAKTSDVTANGVTMTKENVGADGMFSVAIGGGNVAAAIGFTPNDSDDTDTINAYNAKATATVGGMTNDFVRVSDSVITGSRLVALGGGLDVVAAMSQGTGDASANTSGNVANNMVAVSNSVVQASLSKSDGVPILVNGSLLLGAARVGAAVATGSGAANSASSGSVNNNAIQVSDSVVGGVIASDYKPDTKFRLSIAGALAAMDLSAAVGSSGGATATSGLVSNNSVQYTNTDVGGSATVSAVLGGLNGAVAYNGTIPTVLTEADPGAAKATAGGVIDNSVVMSGGTINGSRVAVLGAGVDVAAAISSTDSSDTEAGGAVSATAADAVSGNNVTASDVTITSILTNPSSTDIPINGAVLLGAARAAVAITTDGVDAAATTSGAVSNNTVSLSDAVINVVPSDPVTEDEHTTNFYSGAVGVSGVDVALANAAGDDSKASASGGTVSDNTISLVRTDISNPDNSVSAFVGGVGLAVTMADTSAAAAGNVSHNTITVTDSTVDADIAAALVGGVSAAVAKSGKDGTSTVTAGAVNDNQIVINSGTLGGNSKYTALLGGAAAGLTGTSRGTDTITTGAVSGNGVTISGGSVGDGSFITAVVGGIAGGAAINTKGTAQVSTGAVHDNTVTISGGSVGTGSAIAAILGGGAVAAYTGKGTAALSTGEVYDNTVTISGGSIGGKVMALIAGGASVTYPFDSSKGTSGAVHDNKVIISGGEIDKSFVAGGVSLNGEVYENSVTLKGGTVNGDVYGGATYDGSFPPTPYGNNNIVNFYGGNLSNASLHGGTATADGGVGNTLNVYAKDLTATTMDHFQNYYFYVPSDLGKNDTMLTLSTTGTVDMSDATIGVGVATSAYKLRKGDEFTVVYVPGGTLVTNTNMPDNVVSGMQGISTLYSFGLANINDNQLVVKVLSAALNPQTKSLSEMQLAGLSLLDTGADLVAGTGFKSALQEGSEHKGKATVFGTMAGGKLKADTGSYVDARYFNMMAGVTKADTWKNGSVFTKGLFVESGWGSYKTFNNFSDVADIRADGHGNYMGGGILARLDRSSGSYVEGSLHAGHLNTTYGSNDFLHAYGERASYETGSAYYSAHLGIGKIKKLSDETSLDLYGKYFWTHLPSRSADVLGDHFDFDSTSSNRLRLGARWTRSDKAYRGETYFGVAVEREFSGTQDGTTAGFDMLAPSLKGTSGLLEVGWRSILSKDHTFGSDIGILGHIGKRRGIGGSLQFKWLL